ncbi:MAG TPA: hypothetical protein VNZ58_00285 [Thermomicrobiales bacterium]|nr:hypothetical protein [Thermomicrobiales bacterium]
MAPEPTSKRTPLWDQDRFSGLVDHATGAIGRVVSSEREPAGSHEFFFWAAEDALSLDVGHIVVTFSEEAAVIGVVDEPRRYSDLVSFLDDYFDRRMELALPDEGPTLRPEILVFSVKVLATRHQRDDVASKRPAVNGPVFFATEHAIRYALGLEQFSGTPIPALMHTNGNYVRNEDGDILQDTHERDRFQKTPIFLDEDYLLGPEAGHANWTGQSGLATKTSHALFLTSSIFQTMEREEKTVAALMFNVKGPDLLWLDKPAQPEDGMEEAYRDAGWRGLDQDQLNAYESLGLQPRPFQNFNIFAPFKPGMTPQAAAGTKRIDLSGFRDHKDLNTERNVPGQCDRVFPIAWSLERALWYPTRIFDFSDLDDKLMGFIYELRERKVASLAELNELFARIETELGETGEDTWNGHHKATIRKAKNRFKSLDDKFGGLLADGTVHYGDLPQVDYKFTNQELRVVDISACNTNVQEMIVTSTISAIWKLAEKSDMGVDKLIIFIDELNKYAPAGGEGGLRDTLVDIAARGRHLNVVLLGAQQFRSKIDGEILGNCGTSFYGRVGDEEIINAAYRSISDTSKQELLGLAKGRLLVRHAHFRAPLFGTFPLPPSIPGINGQRAFGKADRWQQVSQPGDVIFRMLRNYMGDRVTPKAEVLGQCEGLDFDDIEDIRIACENIFRGNSNGRTDHWKVVRKQLTTRRSMKTLS